MATPLKTRKAAGRIADAEKPADTPEREQDRNPVDSPRAPTPPTTVGPTKSTPRTNQNLAGQATDVLLRLNSFAAFGARIFEYDLTAEALDNAKDPFREAVYDALLIDPELARWIMRGGTDSGKIALLVAYLMLAGAVIPVATLERKGKVEARKDKQQRIVDEARQAERARS